MCLLLSSCPGWEEPAPAFTQYSPVMMQRSDMEQIIGQQPSRDIQGPAKIYACGHYLFISEKFQGIHVIDNQQPARPVNLGFIRSPGCVDMAVMGITLFADQRERIHRLDVIALIGLRGYLRRDIVFFDFFAGPTLRNSWIAAVVGAPNKHDNIMMHGYDGITYRVGMTIGVLLF